MSRVVPTIFAALAFVLLLAGLAFAVVHVSVPRDGDTSAYTCAPLGNSAPPSNCAAHTHGRLVLSTLAGLGAGLMGLVAFVAERQMRNANLDEFWRRTGDRP